MDFGVLDGLVSSENNNKNTLISCGDLDLKTKLFESGGGFCKQETSVSASATVTDEDEWRNFKMAKIVEDDISKTMQLQHHRSNGAQSMLSFSLLNTQSTFTFPYYARNYTGYGAGGPFTPSQWMELEHQALIYKYITANTAIPSNLLIPIKKALETAAYSACSGGNFRQNHFGWGALHLGFCNSSDPEPGRCRRTDGKKWRCAKDAVADQKYCERHMNRGRHRSRKPVEAQNCQSLPTNTTAGASKLTTGSTVLRHTTKPNSTASSQDNRKANIEANIVPMLSSSSIPVEKNQVSNPKEESSSTEFGLVCSDSLLNPMHKSDLKPPNSLHQFMEDWPHSSQTTLSATSERLDLSPLRMGLGMGKHRVPGGPLGEVLHHSTNNSPTVLNLMTEQMAPPSMKTPLGYLL